MLPIVLIMSLFASRTCATATQPVRLAWHLCINFIMLRALASMLPGVFPNLLDHQQVPVALCDSPIGTVADWQIWPASQAKHGWDCGRIGHAHVVTSAGFGVQGKLGVVLLAGGQGRRM